MTDLNRIDPLPPDQALALAEAWRHGRSHLATDTLVQILMTTIRQMEADKAAVDAALVLDLRAQLAALVNWVDIARRYGLDEAERLAGPWNALAARGR